MYEMVGKTAMVYRGTFYSLSIIVGFTTTLMSVHLAIPMSGGTGLVGNRK